MNSISEIMTALMNSEVAWTVLALVSVASAVFAIFTWVNGKERKRIGYVLRTNSIVRGGDGHIENLSITYNGSEVDSVLITKIAIWNSGNRVLSPGDFAALDPLAIGFGTNRLLDSQLLCESEDNNQIQINNSRKDDLCISFDYIEPGQGAVIQLIHTGQSEEISIRGKIKGGVISQWQGDNVGGAISGLLPLYTSGVLRKILACSMVVATALLLVLIALLLMVCSIDVYSMSCEEIKQCLLPRLLPSQERTIPFIAVSVILWILLLFVSIQEIKQAFSVGIPKKLVKYL